MDSLPYLVKIYRRYSQLLDNAVSSLDFALIHLSQCVSRLGQLAEMPHQERLKSLVTKPSVGRHRRDWLESDWIWFKGFRWDEILDIGYKLYQVQQCVSLWGARCSTQVAVALTTWACMALVGDPMPQYINVSSELSESCFKQGNSVAAERAVELKNLLIAWSTSIPHADPPFPQIKLPRIGGLGDGLSMYGSDVRRRIPEPEMAAAAGRTIADNWQKILRARLRRFDVIPLDDEHNIARKLFAAAGGRDAEPNSSPTPKKEKVPSKRGHIYIPTPVNGPQLQTYIKKSRPSTISPPTYTATFTPPPERTIEQMLADADSSDGAYGSTDDEAQPKPTLGLGLTNLGEKKTPFAFSIGPDGFSVNTYTPEATPLRSMKVEPSAHSSSSVSPSPVLISRQRTGSYTPSDAGYDSASETARILPYVKHIHSPPRYRKTMKRDAQRRSVSRSATPASVASPMSTVTSLPMSPSASVDIPLRELSDRVDFEGDHVGLLIREREQYQTYHPSNERAFGRLVSAEVEVAMKKWVAAEKEKGTIPEEISPAYLASLGLRDDPQDVDLGPWVERISKRMSPVEALLRAGIEPTEFPPHHIVHSLLHLDQQLNLYLGNEAFAPIGQDINQAQLDKELELLFKNGEQKFDHIILSKAEQAKRKKQIDELGLWDEDDTPTKPKPRKTLDQLEGIVSAFEAEEGEGEGIQDAMLSGWWTSKDGRPREVAFSDDGDIGSPDSLGEIEDGGKAKRPGKMRPAVKNSGEGKAKKPIIKRKSPEEVGLDGTVQPKTKKARTKKVGETPVAVRDGIVLTTANDVSKVWT